MKKRIFLSIICVALLSVLMTLCLTTVIMYESSSAELKKEVANEADYIGKAIEAQGSDFSAYIMAVGRDSSNRITLVSQTGTVVYDNYVSIQSMDNHSSRPEIVKAMASGSGSLTRYSDTLGKSTYYYALKLNTGDIIRVACTTKNIVGALKHATLLVVPALLFIGLLSIVTAKALTRSIIKPINNLNLDAPGENKTYDELSPLLIRMEKQNTHLEEQVETLFAKNREIDYITNNIGEAIIIFSPDGNVLSCNIAAQKFFLCKEGDSYLRICRDNSYVDIIEKAFHGTNATGRIAQGGHVFRLSANAISRGKGSFAVFLFITDITQTEQAEQMRREFSANVSHELKTPLTSIIGCSEIIENGIAKPEDVSRFAGQIRREAARLLALIQDIIKLSRLDEENLSAEFADVDLTEICQSTLSRLESKAKAADVQLEMQGECHAIRGFEPVLREMVFNLCDNAIIYNKKGGSVTLSLKEQSDKIILTVADTGVGIAPEHQSRVFERFYRIDKSHSKETGGTGLGLSIVKHGALLHKAALTLKSTPNKGTEITLTFTP